MTIAISATAAAPAAPATTAAVSAARGPFFPRPGLVNRQRTTLKVLLVKHRDRLGCVFLGAHFDEGKPAGATRRPVLHNVYRDDGTRLGEVIL